MNDKGILSGSLHMLQCSLKTKLWRQDRIGATWSCVDVIFVGGRSSWPARDCVAITVRVVTRNALLTPHLLLHLFVHCSLIEAIHLLEILPRHISVPSSAPADHRISNRRLRQCLEHPRRNADSRSGNFGRGEQPPSRSQLAPKPVSVFLRLLTRLSV